MDIKTVNDLRSMLVEEMTKVRGGQSTPATLNALVNGCGKVFSSIKLEIEYNKAIGKTPFIPMLKGSSEEEQPNVKPLKAVEAKK